MTAIFLLFTGYPLTALIYMNKPPIVFIHGLFQNPKSWEHWKAYFESLGYTCHAPAYPFHTGEPSLLRKNIRPDLKHLTLRNVTESIEYFIAKLPQKPVLIGHSMGGLVAQILLSKDKAVAAACIDSAPPAGIFSFKWSFIRANLATVNPFKGNTVFLPGVKWFHYAFCNLMTMEETKREYESFVVPESRNVPRSSIGREGRVDFSKPHFPLLFIAGEKDHIIPPSLNMKNYRAYKHQESRKEFKEFPGRTHYICGQKNWEEVADYIHSWIDSL
jgi:pimeloyl-ACP methyl ester carboxylesterase